jgi:predicted amidohydrolase YtcJ
MTAKADETALRLFSGLRWVVPGSGVKPGSLLVGAERILAFGSKADRIASAAGAEAVHLPNRLAIPGLIDCHAHLGLFGLSEFRQADLTGCSSIDELLHRLWKHAGDRPNAAGGWLLGHRFDQELLAEKRFPTRAELDSVAPDRPAVITRVCCHAVVANTVALQIAGIQSDSGLLTEGEAQKLLAAIPEPTEDELRSALLHAAGILISRGFTCAHCIVSNAAELRAIFQLCKSGEMPLRIRLVVPFELLHQIAELGLATGFGNSKLTIGPVKIFADGSLGARTAALSQPYADAQDTSGTLVVSPEELEDMVWRIHSADCQAAIHAIGDLAVEHALRAVEEAQRKYPRSDPRHRIEHASVTRPDLIPKMVDLGVGVCVQPQFVTSDFWTAQRLGEARVKWAYPFKSMLAAGVHLGGGTDCPVENPNPWAAFAAATERSNLVPEESLTADQALDLFTRGAAWLSFSEGELGQLTPGALADFVVLPPETQWPPNDWNSVSVEAVFVGGERVWPA